ncbi:MAG: hypothetical protein ABS999_22315 [Pseudomonas atacamensis]|uniref:hypothetical protein n=1 Tax=Pseudomonas atacamensis TaxID=2565368 RepID=UPI0033148E2F
MAEEQQLPTERRKREKAATKDVALGVEKFTVEVAGVFKPDLKRVMAARGINNQKDIHQRLLKNLIFADVETQAWMLRNVTTPCEIPERCREHFTSRAWPKFRQTLAMKSFTQKTSSLQQACSHR